MKKVFLRAILVFIVFVIGASYGYHILAKKAPLKVFTPADFNQDLVDNSLKNSAKDHFIGDFKLINQDGDTVSALTFKDKIYVADFIFTTCPGMCKTMTGQLSRVNKQFLEDPEVAFISHSVKPVEDSVPVLKAYAEKHNAMAPKWNIVTGNKKLIYKLARKDYFAAITEGDGGENDFIHSQNLILVDKQKRIRGVYDGRDFDDVDRLIEEIKQLKEEYE